MQGWEIYIRVSTNIFAQAKRKIDSDVNKTKQVLQANREQENMCTVKIQSTTQNLKQRKGELESKSVFYKELESKRVSYQEKIDLQLLVCSDGSFSLFPHDASFAEKIQALYEQSSVWTQKLIDIKGELKRLQTLSSVFVKNRNLLEKRQQMQQSYDSWQRLHIILSRGLRFRDFAQILQLSELIELANQQLMLIAKEYHISIRYDDDKQPTLDFEVSKNGKTSRPLSTLSGGETFLVALAFALALAHLRKVHMPIQTLLIDEGFGSLDHESADTVVSGLEALKKRNIQVGLISHVTTLQARIAARTDVTSLGCL